MKTIVLLVLGLSAFTMACEKHKGLKAVSAGSSQFAANLFKAVAKDQKKNIVMSPISAHVLLSMVSYGADGNTAKQMTETLHLPEDSVQGKEGFQNLMDHLNAIENVTLEMANTMYLGKNLKLKPEFKEMANTNFRSEAAEVDFGKATEAADTINGWASEKTHQKITKLLDSSDISEDIRMLLLNAIYFKGNWAREFKTKDTEPKPFHVDEQTTVNVSTMFIKNKFVYGELENLDAKFVKLPYQNKNVEMVIVVPNAINGLDKIIDNVETLDQETLNKAGWEREVFLYLPKFKIENGIELNEPLKKLGLTEMFSNNANFKGISEEALKVARVFQKAMIEVNEQGSEAAAVTVGEITLMSLPITFTLVADRPYYYHISDKCSGTILFQGVVTNPQ